MKDHQELKPEDTLILNDVALRGIVTPADRVRLRKLLESERQAAVKEAVLSLLDEINEYNTKIATANGVAYNVDEELGDMIEEIRNRYTKEK